MQSGRLKHRITIWRRVQTPDGGGGVATTLHQVKETWASVEPLSSGRVAFLRQSGLRATHSIVMRYDEEVDSEVVIGVNDRRFTIEGMENPGEESVELRMTVVELGRDSSENI